MSAVVSESAAQLPAVAEPRTAVVLSPLEMVRAQIAECADLTRLEKLMELEKRWHEEQAKRAYVKAFADFKVEMPPVFKDLINKQYDSEYSSLGNLVNSANVYLGKHGLNARWDFIDGSPAKGTICLLTHVDGHTEKVWVTGPLDNTGQKNELQKIKSTSTYLMGMAFQAVTGIVAQAACLDDDGSAAGVRKKQKEVDKPADLEKWMADCKAVADEGSAKLGNYWEKATPEIRRYIKTYEEAWFNQQRRTAAKASAALRADGVPS